MRRSLLRTAAALAFFAASTTLVGAQAGETLSTTADATSVDVTVYNGDLALVHDRRHVSFAGGPARIAWRDVAARMQPETALLSEPARPRDLSIVEQDFDYDVLGAGSILAKYVGHELTVTHAKAAPGRPARETARLLAVNDGNVVLQYADRIETSVDGQISYPSLPRDLRDRPTLVLTVDTRSSGSHDLDLAYLTSGIAWHAEYAGVLAPGGKTMDLQGLVTLSNQSGATYRDAHLQLVAGNVNAPPRFEQIRAMAAISAYPPPPTPAPIVEENYFEYHLYTVKRPTTIEQNQTKQIELLSAHAVPIVETLEIRGDGGYYRNASSDLGDKLPVQAYVTFANKGGDLGVPLPGGSVRLYENDGAGNSLFLGGDAVGHTPANQDVRLHVGASFDVTANKRQTDFTHVSSSEDVSSYSIVVSNAKKEPADVLVVEQLPCAWSISEESARHQKTSSATATWHLHVPQGGSTKLDYRADVRCL